MAFTIVIDYFAGPQIEKATGKTRRNYLIISIAANVLVLAIFKYYNFLNDNVTWLLNNGGYHNPIPYLSILLPIGLSFHTFQAMSYTIEVYRGKQKAEKHFGIYALYVMFYPQLVAGPIERPQNILHQFKIEHYFNYDRVTRGLRFMLWGFFLKIAIADNMALVANNVFDNYERMGGLATLIGAIAFTIQIFCDFAGYSSIAIGAALVMGFGLMANFRQPYLATSVSDFWSRWHISLSTWFKDYLYIPLGGNRVKVPRWCLNILIVFAVSGLWHGASWTFLIWGVLHGLLLIVERISKPLRSRVASFTGLSKLPLLTRVIKTIMVFILVSITWIFFRAETLHQAVVMIRDLFGAYTANDGRGAISPWGTDSFSKFPIMAALAILAFEQFYREFKWQRVYIAAGRYVFVRWSIYLFLLFTIFLFGAYQGVRFIYFQF